jgi:tetratricopeptide (TPR) repeat protein
MTTHRRRGPAALALLALALAVSPAPGQPTADQQAEMLLNTARRAYADANYPFAAEKFREFLAKFGGHKDASAARYGLGLALLDLPDRDYQKALEALTPAANDAAFPDRALALYYSGVARRGMGQKELAERAARANEMPQRQQAANAHFAEAGKFFAQAREAFEKKTPPDADWSARARCDAAEMELRLGKTKEARAAVEPFVKDAALAKSPSRPLGLYYHGFACFLLDDVPAAARSLGPLAPFDQPFGLHARYLVGRLHAAQDEKAEAAAAFAGVLAGHEEQKKAAAEALKQPDRFKNDPWEKARLEAVVKDPPPDYVAGAAFYGACLSYEAGKFGEALPKFQAFAKEYAASPLKDDAALRAGFCRVQSKAFDEAAKTLQPLGSHPRLGYQAMYWLGKAQLGQALAADPNNANARNQAFANAINSLRDAAAKAAQLGGQGDADAKARRPEILLEQADAHLVAGQAQAAGQVYDQIANEKLLPARAEEVLQRAATAYHLAGDVNTSEARVAAFRQQFPNSTLMPLVHFRGAENAYLKAEQLARQNNEAGAKQAYAEAAAKYEEVVKKFPEFESASRARYGLALCHTARGEWEKAAAALEAIPAADRTGDLAPVPYVLADCLVRTAPARAEDALADNMLREKLTAAAGLLETFIGANPRAEQTPDALLKLGLCRKRLAVQLAPGNERNDALNKSRAALERLQREFPQSPLAGASHLERAKVMALQGDKGGAVNALRQFANDPLQKSPVAPLAFVTLASLLREQNQASAAADALKQARDKYEGQLGGDPKRAEWVPLLRYHHGVALLEAGKLAEARTAFEQAVQAAGNRPIAAEAALKSVQCDVEEVKKKVEEIEKERQKPNLTAQQLAEIDSRVGATRGRLVDLARLFEQRAGQFKAALPQSEARARMLYDAAWACRAAGADPVPAYTKLIAEFADLGLAVDARLELAELLADQKKPDEAIKLLREAIDKEPTDRPTPTETLERIRLRLGGALYDKQDFAGAQGQFDAVAANEKSAHRALGLYRSAECLLAQSKADEAVKKLAVFRDNAALHNVPGVSDRALLRLGHALLAAKQWDPARQAFDTVVNRFGANNPWAVDARYGVGLALQNQGRFDDAVNAYVQVVQLTQDDRAGRARLQIGECRAKQSKWADAGKEFQAVYYGYDIPELKYAAMIEHARVLAEEKKPADAVKLLERVVKDAPKDGDWARAAQERLGKIKN